MYYSTIKPIDIADGPGVRVSLFVSGCTNHCPGCFQPETWDFEYGKEFTKETEDELIEMLKSPHIQGITILGGDPFEPTNQEALLLFLKRVRVEAKGKDVWVYTGYRLEELQGTARDVIDDGAERKSRTRYVRTKYTDEMLEQIDVLVDGRFVEALKDITLLFRGSRNQRLINILATLQRQKKDRDTVVMWASKT